MKKVLLLISTFSLSVSLSADVASHRKAAEELVAAVAGPDTVKAGFSASLEPMFQNMRQRGAPPEMIKEFQAAMEDWFNTDIKWSEMQPLVVDIYVQEYTESELTAILAFMKTPVGQKMAKSAPVLALKGNQVGQQYAQTKQASLQARLAEISARYQAKAAAPGAGVPSPAPAPAPAPAK